jgi:hypothetical protein
MIIIIISLERDKSVVAHTATCEKTFVSETDVQCDEIDSRQLSLISLRTSYVMKYFSLSGTSLSSCVDASLAMW